MRKMFFVRRLEGFTPQELEDLLNDISTSGGIIHEVLVHNNPLGYVVDIVYTRIITGMGDFNV